MFMQMNLKKFSIFAIITITLVAAPRFVNAEIQCPGDWVKEMHGVAEVCVAQSQNQNQAQVQNNNQNQNVNQNVVATGGSSSSSSSSNSSITINNPTPTPTATPTSVVYVPQVVYTAPTKVVQLPKTGLPETALALTSLLPIGFAMKKYGFNKFGSKTKEESAASIWLGKNS